MSDIKFPLAECACGSYNNVLRCVWEDGENTPLFFRECLDCRSEFASDPEATMNKMIQLSYNWKLQRNNKE